MTGETTPDAGGSAAADAVVLRRSEHGWQVGGEETADLTSAMVLADLLAADLGAAAPVAGLRSARPAPAVVEEEDDATRLAGTVAQLEHALAARVRVEQAIGVLAERHRLRPRQAFDLLRSVARSGGRRVIEVAENVVDSASNPLLPLPEKLARTPSAPRRRGRSPRHARAAS
jgi:ANTAR domain-containing protein